MQTGFTIFQSTPVTLTWGADNVITLTGNETGEVVFSTTPDGIQQATGLNGQFAIKLKNGKRHNLIFDETAFGNLAEGSVSNQLGLGGALNSFAKDAEMMRNEEATDIDWWQKNLAAAGVKSSYFSQRKQWTWAIAILIVIGLIYLIVKLTGAA